jgi:hypothetical protein
VSGVKAFELSLPPVLSAPETINPGSVPRLTTPSKILVRGDALNIYTDQQFKPGEKFVLTDSKGQQFTVKPVCLSANQAVITVPEACVLGELTVREEVWNQPTGKFDVSRAHVNMIDIKLTSPNTNLRPGQGSFVLAIISGVWEDHFAYSVDLRNLNPKTVTMEGGNLQRVNVDSALENYDFPGRYVQIRRNITGNAVGSFSVSATLHEDYNTSNDPFRPQLNVLNTPESFNAWADALKKDLTQYKTLVTDYYILWPPTTQDFSVIKTNIQRAIDYMPVCTSPEQLDESKAMAYSLMQPLNVPKGAANTWLSGFEAFKSSIASFSGREELSRLFNTAIARNGLDFMEKVALRNNDQPMIQEITNARKGLDIADENTDANMTSPLYGQLRSLISQADKKIATDAVSSIWNYSAMLFSTYCFNKRTKDGIDPVTSMIGYLDPGKKILKVKPAYQQQVLSSLNAVPAGGGYYRVNTISEARTPVTYNVQLIPFVFANTFDSDWWAKHLIEEVLRKDTSRGDIIDTTRKSDGTWYVFYENAKCVLNSYSKAEDRTSDCVKETEWDVNEKKINEPGRYERTTFYPTGSCIKGTGFCTEVYVVSSTTQVFMDANCTRRIRSWDFKHFSCL